METIELPEEVVRDLIEKLHEVCYDSWERYTDVFIVPYDKYTHEEKLQKGDREAYRLIKILQEKV